MTGTICHNLYFACNQKRRIPPPFDKIFSKHTIIRLKCKFRREIFPKKDALQQRTTLLFGGAR